MFSSHDTRMPPTVAAIVLAILSIVASACPPASAEVPADSPGAGGVASAESLFEKLKGLEGAWIGRSAKGWTDEVTYRTIAGGSVVVETSFDAHPGETMMTMFHLDAGRLILTHYCVARNQPRLLATEFGGGGKSATFTFLDATGMASRDAGHMDKAAFTFEDADHFTSRWSWYEGGAERWMEEIRYERRK